MCCAPVHLKDKISYFMAVSPHPYTSPSLRRESNIISREYHQVKNHSQDSEEPFRPDIIPDACKPRINCYKQRTAL